MLDENRTQRVTLGCGTLILIALIVIFFGKPDLTGLQDEVRSLRQEVGELKKAVSAETMQVKAFQEKIDRQNLVKDKK